MLETIYQQGYQNELVDRTQDKILAFGREQAQRDMQDLQKPLSAFEAQYHLSSQKFYQRFHRGELGDEVDYFELSACYNMYESACERFKALSGEMA